MDKIISVKNLCREYVTYERGNSFGEAVKSLFIRKKIIVQAVKNISFDISGGEIIGLLGENGAGKSTTIKMLTGVLYPTSGEVNVMDFVPFSQRGKYVRHIGAVFGQKSQLIWDIPPLDSFALNKAIYSIPDSDYDKRLGKMLDILDIGGVVKKPTRVLSLGERMKCEFVMAMLHNPRIVFLDEPTIGVDIIAKEAIREFIREMNSEGVTFILTTHDLEDVERLARRVIIINHGDKVFEDSLDALKRHLGDNKTVKIKMKTPVPPMSGIEGVSLISEPGGLEAELLVNNAVLPINDFISYISNLGDIQDIAIKEPGIESVIKSIYGEGK